MNQFIKQSYLVVSQRLKNFADKAYLEGSKNQLASKFNEKLFKLSMSKLELFIECSRCFYFKVKLGINRPGNGSFSLHNAVDVLLKKEFDIYRNEQKTHPLCIENNINAVPFNHTNIQKWRTKGLQYIIPSTNMLIEGKIDDIWIDRNTQELIVVDYKATSKSSEITLDYDSYKRQVEIYQWLLRQNGFNVSHTAYFVYCNGKKDSDFFDKRLNFDIVLLKHIGTDSWIDEAILSAQLCLQSNTIPLASAKCKYCIYLHSSLNVLQ